MCTGPSWSELRAMSCRQWCEKSLECANTGKAQVMERRLQAMSSDAAHRHDALVENLAAVRDELGDVRVCP